MDITLVAILITILVSLLGVAFGYGILTNKVTNHQREIQELKNSFSTIDKKLDDICAKVASIETTLKERQDQTTRG